MLYVSRKEGGKALNSPNPEEGELGYDERLKDNVLNKPLLQAKHICCWHHVRVRGDMRCTYVLCAAQ